MLKCRNMGKTSNTTVVLRDVSLNSIGKRPIMFKMKKTTTTVTTTKEICVDKSGNEFNLAEIQHLLDQNSHEDIENSAQPMETSTNVNQNHGLQRKLKQNKRSHAKVKNDIETDIDAVTVDDERGVITSRSPSSKKRRNSKRLSSDQIDDIFNKLKNPESLENTDNSDSTTTMPPKRPSKRKPLNVNINEIRKNKKTNPALHEQYIKSLINEYASPANSIHDVVETPSANTAKKAQPKDLSAIFELSAEAEATNNRLSIAPESIDHLAGNFEVNDDLIVPNTDVFLSAPKTLAHSTQLESDFMETDTANTSKNNNAVAKTSAGQSKKRKQKKPKNESLPASISEVRKSDFDDKAFRKAIKIYTPSERKKFKLNRKKRLIIPKSAIKKAIITDKRKHSNFLERFKGNVEIEPDDQLLYYPGDDENNDFNWEAAMQDEDILSILQKKRESMLVRVCKNND